MMVREEIEGSRYRRAGSGMMVREEMEGNRYRQASGDDFGSTTVKGKQCNLQDCEP